MEKRVVSQLKKVPQYFEKNDKLVTDCCIWCKLDGEMSESHLFPEYMGARFVTFSSCTDCNTFLGTKFEALGKRNAFMTAALCKTGLSTKQEAYRHARKIDEETGLEMHISDDGYSKPVPKKLADGKFLAPQGDKSTASYFIKRFKKQHPNFPVEPLKDFFGDNSPKSMKYVGEKYKTSIKPGGPGELKLEGLTRDPDPRLVFKIVFEFLSLNGFQSHTTIGPLISQMYSYNEDSTKDRIVLSEQAYAHIFSNTSNCFSQYRRLEDINFQPYHGVIMRLSQNLVLYVEAIFFGVLRSFFVLGRLNERDDYILPLIDLAWIFPFGDPIPELDIYPNLRLKDHIVWTDAAAEVTLWEIEKHFGKDGRCCYDLN